MDKEEIEEFDSDEDQEAFTEWWKSEIPDTVVSVLDHNRLSEVMASVKHICSVIAKKCECEDEMPTFSLKYDSLFGTDIGFDCVVTEFGITISEQDLKSIAHSLPKDSNMLILPRTDNKTLIQFTYRNVKKLV